MLSAFLRNGPAKLPGFFIGGNAGFPKRTGAGIERRVRPRAPGLAGQFGPDRGDPRQPRTAGRRLIEADGNPLRACRARYVRAPTPRPSDTVSAPTAVSGVVDD